MRASSSGRHELDRRSQSWRVGVRLSGSDASAVADVVEAQPDLLGDAHERDPPDRVAGVAPLAAGRAGGVDQPLGLVEAQRRRGDAGAAAEIADRQARRGQRAHRAPRRRHDRPEVRPGAGEPGVQAAAVDLVDGHPLDDLGLEVERFTERLVDLHDDGRVAPVDGRGEHVLAEQRRHRRRRCRPPRRPRAGHRRAASRRDRALRPGTTTCRPRGRTPSAAGA